MKWQTGKPPDHGYYLGAWRRGSRWHVSELWYNPDSGWWPTRGYLHGYLSPGSYSIKPIPVTAWMPKPEYPAEATMRDLRPYLDNFGNISVKCEVGGAPGAVEARLTGASAKPAQIARFLRELADEVEALEAI
jgi:hypothetical protein